MATSPPSAPYVVGPARYALLVGRSAYDSMRYDLKLKKNVPTGPLYLEPLNAVPRSLRNVAVYLASIGFHAFVLCDSPMPTTTVLDATKRALDEKTCRVAEQLCKTRQLSWRTNSPTRENILDAIRSVADMIPNRTPTPSDNLVVYIAGHGINADKSADKCFGIALSNTSLYSEPYLYDGLYSIEKLRLDLDLEGQDRWKQSTLVIVDACHAAEAFSKLSTPQTCLQKSGTKFRASLQKLEAKVSFQGLAATTASHQAFSLRETTLLSEVLGRVLWDDSPNNTLYIFNSPPYSKGSPRMWFTIAVLQHHINNIALPIIIAEYKQLHTNEDLGYFRQSCVIRRLPWAADNINCGEFIIYHPLFPVHNAPIPSLVVPVSSGSIALGSSAARHLSPNDSIKTSEVGTSHVIDEPLKFRKPPGNPPPSLHRTTQLAFNFSDDTSSDSADCGDEDDLTRNSSKRGNCTLRKLMAMMNDLGHVVLNIDQNMAKVTGSPSYNFGDRTSSFLLSRTDAASVSTETHTWTTQTTPQVSPSTKRSHTTTTSLEITAEVAVAPSSPELRVIQRASQNDSETTRTHDTVASAIPQPSRSITNFGATSSPSIECELRTDLGERSACNGQRWIADEPGKRNVESATVIGSHKFATTTGSGDLDHVPASTTKIHMVFSAAMKRGSVKCRSIKVLFLGATEAGKTALVAALRREELPDEEDRSVATRVHKMRMVYNAGTGVFETVPLDELRLASLLAGHDDDDEEEEDVEGKDRMTTELLAVDEESNEDEGPAELSVTPSLHVHTASDSATVPRPPTPDTTITTDPHHPPPPTTSPSAPSSAAMSTTMAFVRGLLANEIHEEHVDFDAFDFAGESMYDSLPALFMGSESVYVLVFDLSVMNFPRKAQHQYEHLTKWAHIIAHQVPFTDKSYFRVIIVGTHIDTFPRNTVPADLLLTVSREILRLVGPALGSHLMMPPDTSGLSFFQVGSRARLGLSAVSTAMHKAVRDRTLPLEMVAAQDLIGRWARLGNLQLMSSVDALDSLELNDTPHVTLGGMMPTADAIRDCLVPYLESAADILVCRADATSQRVCDTDTIVFDVPRLIGALELLCSVVMAQWGRAKSKRALAMLREVEAAGNACDLLRTNRLLAELTAAQCESECGFPAEVAEWLVWTAARSQSKTLFVTPSEAAPKSLSLLQKFSRMLRPRKPDLIPLLAGADVTDVPAFMLCLERLSLALRRGKQLVVPMLLPAHAPFLDAPVSHPAQVFLYQFIHDELLPVSLATFHLLMVALWRESLLNSPIRATQRCTNAMTMEGCIPLRLRLNANESFVRIELTDDSDAVRVQRTLDRICVAVCNGTRSLRWGWRGTPVLVPAHPFNTNAPLFSPADVAQASEAHRRWEVVGANLAAHAGGARVCNEQLEQWWVATQPQGHVLLPPGYTHAAALVVGVSRYSATPNPVLAGVRESVDKLAEMWTNRDFKVRTVVDRHKGDRVTRNEIVAAARALAEDVGRSAGRDTLLVVHLLGHGVEDTKGGLLLSDAQETVGGRVTRFTLDALYTILQDEVGWRGCNVLVVCDFCNAGALRVEETLTMSWQGAPVPGYGRQLITGSLKDAPAWTGEDETTLTRLLVDALGPKQCAFEAGETVISAVELCRRMQSLDPNMSQSLSVGRIWSDWDGVPNNGDIFFYRSGNGVESARALGP